LTGKRKCAQQPLDGDSARKGRGRAPQTRGKHNGRCRAAPCRMQARPHQKVWRARLSWKLLVFVQEQLLILCREHCRLRDSSTAQERDGPLETHCGGGFKSVRMAPTGHVAHLAQAHQDGPTLKSRSTSWEGARVQGLRSRVQGDQMPLLGLGPGARASTRPPAVSEHKP
jgi:hypothetical protein